ncbi:MAG TPA: AAA family ATPase [Streptosporangiaceae bacterium]|nr:AAA family ATPase [Streptosporangiaceae bacterium]
MADIDSSVVLITSSDPGESRFGSGFVIARDADTYIVTCAHVVRDVGGPDKVTIEGQPATVVALAPEDWPDLAVLRTGAAEGVPTLAVSVGGARGDTFESAGFQQYSGQHLIRRVSGQLGDQLGLATKGREERIRAFELLLAGEARLQSGYSGSPVVARRTGAVIAVISHREGAGAKGLGVTVDALRLIWPDFDQLLLTKAAGAGTPRQTGLALESLRERTVLFVGRQEELSLFARKLDEMWQGAGSVGFILGEAGMGKSTLALRMVREVLEKHPATIFALARLDVVMGTHTSFAPFKAIMEQILRSDQSADDSQGRQVRPIDVVAETLIDMGISKLGPIASFTGTATNALRQRLAESGRAGDDSDMASSFDQGSLLDCYAEIMHRVSALFPLVILLDDIHWSDDSSLLLLRHLGHVVQSQRVLILATYRPEEAAGRALLQEAVDQLGSLGGFTIDLQSRELSRSDPGGRRFCLDYLHARYGTHFGDRFVDLVTSLVGGNPLFLAETLTNLEERGEIVQSGGEWKLVRSVESLPELPTRIEHVIRQRVNRLDQDLISTLKYGSIEGEIFTAEVVGALQHIEDPQLMMTIIGKLISAYRLIIEVSTRRMIAGKQVHSYSFRHLLTQRYIYEHLMIDAERQVLHKELAVCLEELYGTGSPELLPRLATHYSLAEVPDKTVQYALLAGEDALANYGWGEAARLGRLGLRMVETYPEFAATLGPETHVRLRLLYAKAELEGGLADEPIDHAQVGLDTLLPVLDQIDQVNPGIAVDVYLTLGRLTAVRRVLTDFHANEYVREAISIAERTGDKRALIKALTIRHVTTNVADQSMAAEQLEARKRCVRLAEELDDPALLAECLSWLAVHYVIFDTDEEDPLRLAEEYGSRALRIAETQNIMIELDARIALSWIYHHRGYYGERLENHRIQILEMAAAHGQTAFEADARTDLSHYYSYFVGEQESALRQKREAYDFRVRMGRHPVIDTEHLAELLFRLGRLSESRELFLRFLDKQDEQRAARARALVARSLALAGQEDEALALLAQVEDVVTRANLSMVAPVHGAAMEAYAALGRTEDALRHAGAIIPTVPAAGRRGQFWTYADFPTKFAEVYRLAGDLTAAVDWLAKSSGYWSELATVTDVTKLVMFAEHDFVRGKVLADLGRGEEARPVIERAREAFERSQHYLMAEALLMLSILEGEADAPDRGRTLALDAAARAEEIGLMPLARRAHALGDA